MSSSPYAVEVHDVTKRYKRMADRRSTLKELIVRGKAKQVDEFHALTDVTLNIRKGSVYGLVGHNGSGKSTLLKVIAGISRPSAGSVAVDGRLAALIELGAGFHPDLTGRENIRLNGSILGLGRREIVAATGDIIEFSGLGDFIDEPVKNYSSGMYVRLGFSVAVHMRPDVLLIDEVIAVGDEDFQRKCFDHLYALRKSGRTIIIVSHATSMLASLCDEIAWLDHGQLVHTGGATSVVDSYIASVNATEGAERADSTPAGDTTGRAGSGEIRITSVEAIGADGEPTAACVNGEPMRIRIAFMAHERVEDPVFGIEFQHESGAVITSVTSRAAGDRVSYVAGGGYIDYVQDPCRFGAGNYRVDVGVADASITHIFDEWPSALDLAIRPRLGIARGGLVHLPDYYDTSAVVQAAQIGRA